MNNKGIDSYYSPVNNYNKRTRSKSSPDQLSEHKRPANRGEGMSEEIKRWLDDFEKRVCKTIDEKLSTLATKVHIDTIMGEIRELREEDRGLRAKIEDLQSENKVVMGKLIDLENRARRNNVIFKGLVYNYKEVDCKKMIKEFCVDFLGANKDLLVNRAHCLGKQGNNRPIIAHIPYDDDVTFIFKNSKKLKGTAFVIQPDFAFPTRKKRAKLFFLRKELMKKVPDLKTFVSVDKLIVNGHGFTWDDEKGLCFRSEQGGAWLEQDGIHKLEQIIGCNLENMIGRLNEVGVRRNEGEI